MIIKHAALQLLDKDSGNLVLAKQELERGSAGAVEYMSNQIDKFGQGELKTGKLDQQHELYEFKNENNFLKNAEKIAQRYFEITQSVIDVPSGDLLFVTYNDGADEFLAVLKLDFKSMYVHGHDVVEGGVANRLMINQEILPQMGQRANTGVIVNLNTGDFLLDEKKYSIDGKRVNAWSELILNVSPNLSDKAEIGELRKAIKSVADKYDVPISEALPTAQQSIFEQVMDNESIDVNALANEVFDGNDSAKQDFKKTLSEKEVPEVVDLENPLKYTKKFAIQRFKTGSGVEIAIPMEIYKDKDKVDIVNNPDGSVVIKLQDATGIESKFNS